MNKSLMTLALLLPACPFPDPFDSHELFRCTQDAHCIDGYVCRQGFCRKACTSEQRDRGDGICVPNRSCPAGFSAMPNGEQCGGFVEGPMIEPRAYHTATLLLDGRVLVVGGKRLQISLAEALVFDAQGKSFAVVAPMQHARMSHTATRLSDGRVAVIGGMASVGADFIDAVEIYDSTTDTWQELNPMLAGGRAWHTAALLTSDRILVAGGARRDTGGVRAVADTEILDVNANQWSSTDPMPEAVIGHVALTPYADYVWQVGGQTLAGFDAVAEGFMSHAAVLMTGRVIVSGGLRSNGTVLKDVLLRDPTAPSFSQWRPTGSLAEPRCEHTMTDIGEGWLLAAGGTSSTWDSISSAEIFLGDTETWVPAQPLWVGRGAHTATRLNNNDVLFVGGTEVQSGQSSPTERFIIVQ